VQAVFAGTKEGTMRKLKNRAVISSDPFVSRRINLISDTLLIGTEPTTFV